MSDLPEGWELFPPNQAAKSDYINFKFALDYGVNLKNRSLRFCGDVDEIDLPMFMEAINEFERMDPDGEITIYISTFGGCEYTMFAVYDALRSSPCPIKTVGEGHVMSAGILMFLAGDHDSRYCLKNTQFMFHKGSSFLVGEASNNEVTMDHYKKLGKVYLKEIAARTKKTVKYWRDIEKEIVDKYMTPIEAKASGIVNHIIQNQKS